VIAQGIVSLLIPELTLIIGACVILLIGIARSPALRSLAGWLALVTVLAALITTWYASLPAGPLSNAGLRLTNLTWYVRLIALGIGLLVLLVHWPRWPGPPSTNAATSSP